MEYQEFILFNHENVIIPFYKGGEGFVFHTKNKQIDPIKNGNNIRIECLNDKNADGAILDEIVLNGEKFLMLINSIERPLLESFFSSTGKYLKVIEKEVSEYVKIHKRLFNEAYNVDLSARRAFEDVKQMPDFGVQFEASISKNREFGFRYLKRLVLKVPVENNLKGKIPDLLHNMANKYQSDFMSLVKNGSDTNSNSKHTFRKMSQRQRSAMLSIVREMQRGQVITNATKLAAKRHGYSVRGLDVIKAQILNGEYKCPEFTEVLKSNG